MRKLGLVGIAGVASCALLGGGGRAHAQAPDGAALYVKHCKNCHGPAGGEPSAAMKARMDPPALFTPDFQAKTDDAKFMEAMQKGGKRMRSLSAKMTKPEMEAVMKYVRDYAKNGGR